MADNKHGTDQEELEIVKPAKKKQKSLIFRLLRILFRIAFGLLLLLLLVRFLISFPAVQNKLVQWTSDYLEGELGTKVRIDYVNIDFFDELLLEGIYIEDQHQDTLLYSESIAADLSLVDLLGSKVVVEALSLNNTTFKLQRYPGERDQNLKFLTDFFKSDKKKSESSFLLNIKNLYLYNTRFFMLNAKLGDYLTLELPKAKIEVADVDIGNKEFTVDLLEMKDLYSRYTKVEGIPVKNPDTTTVVLPPVDSTAKTWSFKIKKAALLNAYFDYDNNKFPMREDGEFDLQHFELDKLNIIAHDGLIKDYIGKWHLDEISCVETGGFTINRLEADMEVREDMLAFYNAELVTPESYLADTVVFNYDHINDMGYFNDRVYLDVNLDGSTLAIEDILVFFPRLRKNAFFRLNKDEKFQLKGKLSSTVNRLKAKDLLVTMKNSTTIKGSFSSRDLTNFEETFMDFDLERFRSNMKDLKLLLPYIDFSESALRLGRINFKGKFFGFFHEFFADGSLSTDLGSANMEMNLDLQAKRGKGAYDGKLSLNEFDLGTFTANPDIGKITVSAEGKGSGVIFDDLDATIVADIKKFTFRDYPYENIRIDGIFNKREFEGKTIITDADVDLDFEGRVNFNDEIPVFNIASNVKHIDLKALNLYDEDYTFGGNFKFDFQGSKLDNIVGQGAVENFILSNGEIHRVDSIVLRSRLQESGYRDISLSSEVLTASLKGTFNVNEIHKPFLRYVHHYYPAFAKKMGIKSDYIYNDSTQYFGMNQTDDARFFVNIYDTKNLTHLLDTNLYAVKDLKLAGSFDAAKDTFEFALEVPKFQYNNVVLDSIFITTSTKKDQGNIQVNINKTAVGDNLEVPPFAFSNRLDKDTLHFNTNIESITKLFKALNFNGKFFIAEDQYQVSLLPSNLSIADKEWTIAGDNYIRFGPGFINTNDFKLQHLDEIISLNSIGAKGLELDIQKMPVDWVENFVKVKQLDFSGVITAKVKANNMFKAEFLNADIGVDSFYINEDYFGKLTVSAETPSLKKPIVFSTNLNKLFTDKNGELKEQSITIRKGKYYPETASNYFIPANSFNFRVQVRNFPINFAEYFISGIEVSSGLLNGNLIFYGDGKEPSVGGSFKAKDIETKIKYLQTTYFIDDGIVNVNNNMFDATGAIVRDELGNTALVSGGMKHQFLKNYELDIAVTSDRFLMMNTTAETTNPLYGKAIGKDATVKFTGPLNEPNLYATATSDKETSIKIPLSGERTSKAVNFITFVNPAEDTIQEREVKGAYGMNIELDVIATPEAEVMLIFDEQVGDIMRGRGNGRLSVTISNLGAFKMFGDYEIEQGDYLFTYQNFINKPFTVRRGGTISWDGDPYQAQLNIDAFYKGLRTAPYNFILEYLNSDQEIEAARRSTNVDLAMKLTGPLTKPDIKFDIEMPNAARELQSYIESKLRTVRADNNELNRQVFGLIILKSFLPSDAAFVQSNQIEDIGFNTVSEVLSNQLSLYLTSLISEVVSEDLSFISGIEFDFNYQRTTDAIDVSNFRSVSSEFQIGLTNRFLDDRLTLGANLGIESSTTSNTYYTGDFVIEYRITDDGRFKFKGYNRTEPDIIGSAIINKTGIGFSYRREFNSFIRKKKVKINPVR